MGTGKVVVQLPIQARKILQRHCSQTTQTIQNQGHMSVRHIRFGVGFGDRHERRARPWIRDREVEGVSQDRRDCRRDKVTLQRRDGSKAPGSSRVFAIAIQQQSQRDDMAHKGGRALQPGHLDMPCCCATLDIVKQ